MKQLGPGEKNQKVITPIGLGKSHNGSWVRIVVRGKSLRISNYKDVFKNITRKILACEAQTYFRSSLLSL